MVEDTVIPEPEGVGAVMPLSFSSISAVTARKMVSSEGAGGGVAVTGTLGVVVVGVVVVILEGSSDLFDFFFLLLADFF